MTVRAMPLLIGVLAVLALAYRYYSAFLAARVAVLDDQAITPAHLHYDGQNFHPTNRWVLFGHHFAAISGAGPLIGPVLAIQFGYLPGLVWLVVGVCLAGAVQDMMVLAISTRRGGRSLAGLARLEIGPVAGTATTLAILYVIIIALAGVGIVVVKALGGGEVPMKAGTVLEFPPVPAIPGSRLEPCFSWSKETTTYAIAGYGFVASILPVWLLLCPRDYLSSFLKIGTIAMLVVGVCVANPTLEAPMVNPQFASGGGPYFDGPIFPYVFICIMCGAVSGFHALVSSGTTPKMVDRERDVRMIGYGAMLMEGLVGIVALIAAAALPNSMYYDINIDLARRPQYQQALKALDVDH